MPTRLDELLESAQQALTLCAAHIHTRPPDDRIASFFRSVGLQQVAGAVNGDLYETSGGRRPADESVFEPFRRERSKLIISLGLSLCPLAKVETELRRPRAILLTALGHSLGGDFSHEESIGFIGDGDDGCLDETPPWDTWIAYDLPSRAIVSWVPAWAGELVDDAISVASLDWMAWADVRNGELTSRGFGRRWE